MTGFFSDPDGSWSSTRVSAFLCVLTGCVIALWGMYANREQAATVAALLGGGAATFYTRSQKPPTP